MHDLKVTDLFAKKNKQYPSLEMNSSGQTTDLFDMEDAKHAVNQYKPEFSMPEVENHDKESLDRFLSAQMVLPRGDGLKGFTVVGRKHHYDSIPVGNGSADPLLNTIIHKLEFQDDYLRLYCLHNC
jgi:hypothetical protein